MEKTIQDVLKGHNEDFDRTDPKEIKMIRHADSRTHWQNPKSNNLRIKGESFPKSIPSLHSLYDYRRELFNAYQSEQYKKNVKGIKYLVVFLGEDGTKARFVGVYKILGQKDSPYAKDEVVLDLLPLDEFKELEETIIVDWGKTAMQWFQYYTNPKVVLEVTKKLEKSSLIPPIKPYLEIILNHPQLELIIENPEWVSHLQKVNCIYAILDAYTGKLYVGSTYNKNGIYGRWVDYARTGHGGNRDLKAIIRNDANYAKANFQWTILEVLDINISEQDAIARETMWKQKLKTNQYGYNNN
jgi:hypothetical protein